MNEVHNDSIGHNSRGSNLKDGAGDVNLLELLWMLVKNRWLIARVVLISGVLSVAYSLMIPNMYESKVTLLPVAGGDAGGGLSALVGGGGLGAMLPFGKSRTDPFQALLSSQELKETLIDEFNLRGVYFPDNWDAERNEWLDPDPSANPSREDILLVFSGRFSISINQENGLVTIAIQDENPKLAEQIASRVPSLLESMLTTMTLTTSKRQRVFIEKQTEIVETRLRDLQERLVNFSPGTSDTYSITTATITIDSSTAQWLADKSDLLKKIAAIELEINLKKSNGVEGLDVLESERDALRSSLEQAASSSGASTRRGDLTTVPISRLPVVAMEYLRLTQELLIQQELYKLLRQQLEMSRIGEAKEAVAFQLVDPAAVSDLRNKVSPKRKLIVLGSAFFGLFTVMVWVFFREGKNKLTASNAELLRTIEYTLSPKTIWNEWWRGMLGLLKKDDYGPRKHEE